MKYKVGDKVKVKSREWYNKNKNKYGAVNCSDMAYFQPTMLKFCENILTIKNIDKVINAYKVEENDYYWVDDMFEGLIENTTQPVVKNIIFSYADKVELHLGDDYEIVVEDGRVFVQKKKPKYPTTYEECCKVLGIASVYTDIMGVTNKEYDLYLSFIKLIRCRDAYWKIAGEEMGLGKPWEPNWNESSLKYTITVIADKLVKHFALTQNFIFAFPTEEMRDAFYENFKDLIEQVIELL